MDKNILKLTVTEQFNSFTKMEDYVKRDVPESRIKTNNVIVISGVRRCGKTTLLKQISQNYKGFYYLNFKDERLLEFDFNDFNSLLEVFYEIYGENDVFLLEEIQNVRGWEEFINRLFSDGKKVFVTGRNTKLLNSEFSTALTGRHSRLELLPLSFKEFLSFYKFSVKELYSTNEKAVLKKYLSQYIEYGGFPEVVISRDKEKLSQIYRDVLINDLIVRFNIKETEAFREFALSLLSNITSNISFDNLKKILGFKSETTVKNYIEYLEESYLMFSVLRYDSSLKRQIINDRKIYSIDTGLYNAVSFSFSENRGKLLENIVFLELKRRESGGEEIFYHKKIKECDFITRKNVRIDKAIQVSESLYDSVTRKRELNGLSDALSSYKLKTGIIITFEEEEDMTYNDYKIKVVPVWKWLLGNYDL